MESAEFKSGKPLLKVAAENWGSWAKIYENEDGKLEVGGPIGNVFKILASSLEFNYEIQQPPDGHWGTLKDDGTWTGMVGMLNRKEVEFALGPFSITPQRATACEFTFPVHNDYGHILSMRPGISQDVSGFLKPFAFQVWLLILASFFFVGTSMIFVMRTEANIFGFSKKHITGRSTQWVITTFAQESSDWMPSKDAGRVVVTTWLLASLVFMSSYSGILTAMLTLPRASSPIDSLEDLASQSKLPWKFEKGTMTQGYLKDSKDPIRQAVAAGGVGYFLDCWVSRKEIARGDFAGLCDDTTIKKSIDWDFSTSGRCHLYMSRKNYIGSMKAIAFKKNSSYLAKANKVIVMLKEAGIIAKWINEQISNATECLKPPGSIRNEGINALGFKSILGPLLLVLGGTDDILNQGHSQKSCGRHTISTATLGSLKSQETSDSLPLLPYHHHGNLASEETHENRITIKLFDWRQMTGKRGVRELMETLSIEPVMPVKINMPQSVEAVKQTLMETLPIEPVVPAKINIHQSVEGVNQTLMEILPIEPVVMKTLLIEPVVLIKINMPQSVEGVEQTLMEMLPIEPIVPVKINMLQSVEGVKQTYRIPVKVLEGKYANYHAAETSLYGWTNKRVIGLLLGLTAFVLEKLTDSSGNLLDVDRKSTRMI